MDRQPLLAAIAVAAALSGGAYAAVFGPEKFRPERVDGLAARPAHQRYVARP